MNNKRRLVVLGSGFAALSLARTIDLKAYDVTIVSPRNHFLFTPLLPSTAVGTIEFRSIIEPIRTVRKGISFVQASCRQIDTEARTIACRGVEDERDFRLQYDQLVIAVGAWNNTFNTPGVTEHAFFLKEVADARRIRERIIASLERADTPDIDPAERARLLQFAVVGGGPTGVEFAAELHDLLREDLKRSYPHLEGKTRIILFEAGSTILGSFDQQLATYALDHFRRHHIEVRLGAPVREVTPRGLVLMDGSQAPAGMVVWSTGYGPTGLVQSLPFKKDPGGRILVDTYMRVVDHPEIFALGDCAVPVGSTVPQTAQAAMQQGKYLGRTLTRIAHDRRVAPFRFKNLGMLAYVGEARALADVPHVRFPWRGFLTYLFWRSAYLTRLVTFKNKAQVLFDWIKTFVFGRDLSRF